MRIVTAGHVQILATDVRGDDLLVSEILLNLAQHVLKTQTELRSLGQPDGQTFSHAVGEHEEFHLFSYLTMVALFGFFQHDEILVEHLFLREGDTIDAFHLLALGIATPECAGNACYLDCLDEPR